MGNPNVGKSVLFGKLTGTYVTVSNYPGTTVEVTRGNADISGVGEEPIVKVTSPWEVVDTPGTNNLVAMSDDEAVTRSILIGERHDALVQVGDAKSLSRVLLLTLQLAETGLPFVLCLNMADELRSRGLRIDVGELEEWLGSPVVAASALRGEGVDEVRAAVLAQAAARTRGRHDPRSIAPVYPDDVEAAIARLAPRVLEEMETEVSARAIALLLLSGDAGVASDASPALREAAQADAAVLNKAHGMPVLAIVNRARLQHAQRIVRQVQRRIDASEQAGFGPTPAASIALGVFAGSLCALILDGATGAIREAAGAPGDPLADYGVVPIVARLISSGIVHGWALSSALVGLVVAVLVAFAARRASTLRGVAWKTSLTAMGAYIIYAVVEHAQLWTRGSTGYFPIAVGIATFVGGLAASAIYGESKDVAIMASLGRMTMRPIAGLPFLAASLFLAYQVVGVFGAGTAVDLLENGLFGGVVADGALDAHKSGATPSAPEDSEPGTHRFVITPIEGGAAIDVVSQVKGPDGFVADTSTPITVDGSGRNATVATLSPGHVVVRGSIAGAHVKGWSGHINVAVYRALDRLGIGAITRFVVGQYGMLTMGLTYAIAIVLPVVATFFFVFSILEDSGYLPRLAVMANRGMRTIGLNGKAVLPMILGLGCDTMATLTARVLESKKERVLTTLLLALAIPCSSQLTVIFAMMQHVSGKATMLWIVVMILTLLVVGWTAARVVPGDRSDFVLEVPPIRRPEIGNLATKTMARIEWYLKEAVPLFLAGSLMLYVLDVANLLPLVHRMGEPIVHHALGFPRENGVSDKVSEALLIGFLRRDFGAAGLLDLARHGVLSVGDVAVSMVVITLFIPCIANVFMMVKERGAKVAMTMAAFIFPYAIIVGAIVRRVMGS